MAITATNAIWVGLTGSRAESLLQKSRFRSMPLTETDREAQLLEDFLGGRDGSFDPLYAAHNQKLFAFVSRMIFDEDAAKDIAHQVWEKVILLRANPERERVQNVGGYLITLARNLALDHIRKTKKFVPLDTAAHLTSSTGNDDRAMVVAALRELPEETREILVLNYYCGYSFEEIAEMLGKKPNAVWTRASRARATLKEILERMMNAERSGR